jgi:sulfatase modifying factor 1
VQRAGILLALLSTAGCAAARAPALAPQALAAPLEATAADPDELGAAAETVSGQRIDARAVQTGGDVDTDEPMSRLPGSCPGDMAFVDGVPADPQRAVRPSDDGGFCIDRYEAPNERGSSPLAFQTAQDGERWCKDRGKHLCTEAEWMHACEGAERRRFPYGDRHVAGACNDDKQGLRVRWSVLARYPQESAVEEAERLYQAEPSGARGRCATPDGVYDMTGNVAEWVARSFPFSKYGHVIKGCFWSGCFGEKHPHCGFVNGVHPGSFRSYEVGFRCCKAQG